MSSDLSADQHLVLPGEGYVVGRAAFEPATFGPKVEAPGLGLVAVGTPLNTPSEQWYREALSNSEPPLVTRLKQTIEQLRLTRATLLDERDALRSQLDAQRKAAIASADRIADLARQLDEAWIEIARRDKGLA